VAVEVDRPHLATIGAASGGSVEPDGGYDRRSLRVLLVSTLDRGGPVEHVLALGRGLAERGVDVRATAANAAVADRLRDAGIAAEPLPIAPGLDVNAARAVYRRARKVDVVHGQDRRAGLWTRLSPRPTRGVRVYTLHGLPDPYLPLPGQPERVGLRATVAYRGLDAALARRADAVVVPSRALARLATQRLGYPAAKLEVLPNGVPVPPEPSAGEGELVATLSVLEPVKALEVFLDAVTRVARRRPDARFAIFGTGSLEGQLRGRVELLGLTARVSLPGHVPAAEALAGMRILVLPSRFENCPMGMLEAMASGVPVIASAVGGIPELAEGGAAALVPAGDPQALAEEMLALLEDDTRRRRVAQAGRARVVDRYSVEGMVDGHLALYERLLRERRG